jgi:integrator complex subunit 7
MIRYMSVYRTLLSVTGLRSGRVGEQCEAIVRFPRLFEKYPFPILINSSLLKLADVFRVG